MSRNRRNIGLDEEIAEALDVFGQRKKKREGRDPSFSDLIEELGEKDPEFRDILHEKKEEKKREKVSLSDQLGF
jgi:predicted CopG family antitoxin